MQASLWSLNAGQFVVLKLNAGQFVVPKCWLFSRGALPLNDWKLSGSNIVCSLTRLSVITTPSRGLTRQQSRLPRLSLQNNTITWQERQQSQNFILLYKLEK